MALPRLRIKGKNYFEMALATKITFLLIVRN
jgi:hypothetical protein